MSYSKLNSGTAVYVIVLVESLLAIGFVVKYFQAPDEGAAVVFALITALVVPFLFTLAIIGYPVPFRYSDPVDSTKSVAFIIVGLFAIYSFGVLASSNLVSFLPQLGSDLASPMVNQLQNWGLLQTVESSSTSTQVQGPLEAVFWAFFVASSEEGMKVFSINVASIVLTRNFRVNPKIAIGGSGLVVIGIWTYYHSFQAIQDWNGLMLAYLAGLVLFASVWYLKNYGPAVILHAAWNLLVATIPVSLLSQPPFIVHFEQLVVQVSVHVLPHLMRIFFG